MLIKVKLLLGYKINFSPKSPTEAKSNFCIEYEFHAKVVNLGKFDIRKLVFDLCKIKAEDKDRASSYNSELGDLLFKL